MASPWRATPRSFWWTRPASSRRAVVWTAPWQAELTGALKAGKNELEIEVTNAWANRLVGDAGLPPEQRITTSNMQFEKGKRTLKAFQGFASEDALQPSGLVGPVTLEIF